MKQLPASFLFHDYETWGISPQYDYPCQFAAIRTDQNLEPIAAPINITATIHLDYLPHPQAVLVTGITPQMTITNGQNEYEFMRQVHHAMMQPNTCVVGYNSIKFDDEVSRYSFYRNFIDPYQREYHRGNSRWDLINLVRACYALRPEGIKWPLGDNGLVSFKLEKLTQENDISHTHAHDALSDVYATIAMAKLILQHQPKLFEYAYQLRSKQAVVRLLEQHQQLPLIYINPYRSAKYGCISIILPMCPHPSNKNATICIELTKDIRPLLNETPETLKRIQYLSKDQRNEDTPEVAMIIIKHNQCPFLAPMKTLSPNRATDLNIDLNEIDQRLACLTQICQDYNAYQNLIMTLTELNTPPAHTDTHDLDAEVSLYSGGFMSEGEKQFCQRIHMTPPEELADLKEHVPSQRMAALLQLFIGRNYAHLLTQEAHSDWLKHCYNRLTQSEKRLTLTRYMAIIEELKCTGTLNSDQLQLLDELTQYGNNHPINTL